MLRDPTLAREMRHRVDRSTDPDLYQDVFDGTHYKDLLTRDVSWKGRVCQPAAKYFQRDTDVALGFGTDGIAPLERANDDFWPLLVTIYNLPPEIRTQREYQICCGFIPGSVDFPTSFTPDLMHILFENIMKQLLGLWDGSPKARQSRRFQEEWAVSAEDWAALQHDITQSHASIPADIARNISVPLDQRGSWTAESWSFFMMFMGPIALQGRLRNPYYKHYLKLAKLARGLTKLVISTDDLVVMYREASEWVEEFEKLYYRGTPDNLHRCTAPIHALLHVVPIIAAQGPPCYYWCFAIERFGGWMKRSIKSRSQILKALTNTMITNEQIHSVLSTVSTARRTHFKGWQDRELGRAQRAAALQDQNDAAPVDLASGFYDEVDFEPNNSLWSALQKHLQSRLMTEGNPDPRINMDVIKEMEFRAYSAYKAGPTGGNQVYRTPSNTRSKRDASWIMYYVAEDRNAHRRIGAAPFRWERSPQCWGQVKVFLECDWDGESLALAVVRPRKTQQLIPEIPQGNLEFCPMQLLRNGSKVLQIVDSAHVTALAGRIALSGRSAACEAIFETTMDLQRAEMTFT
ncbi:hypothetical protein QFC20_007411 [Naganishia adeliensis]|uniref:Uncharacterized protein n=1 Tax=Naganishia adeliensis TaxID=92952 RepID=A0ACC2UZZ3_9TREE|nr:hypothetical protein QFC20_007411 [Naganishia adeliensis]